MTAASQREFFERLNAFQRNYLGKKSLVQFVGLQLRYTGSEDTLVCRQLFRKLYIKFCLAQNTFPADLCQIGPHLSCAGIKSISLNFNDTPFNFYSGILVFGMPWDKPYCSPQHRYVYVSYLPYIEIVVKQNKDERSQCSRMKRHGDSLSRKAHRKKRRRALSGNIPTIPPLEKIQAIEAGGKAGGEEGRNHTLGPFLA